MPEEHNRVETDRLAALLLCPDERSAQTLAGEGVDGRVEVVGDVMLDATLRLAPIARERSGALARSPSSRGATCSRRSIARRTSSRTGSGAIVGALGRLAEPVVFPAHPRTRSRLDEVPPNVALSEPLGYLDLAALASQARVIVTDSGGLQKEAYWYGVPCVTARPSTEWVDTVELGANVLVDADPDALVAAVRSAHMPDGLPPLYGDGHASARIVTALSMLAPMKERGRRPSAWSASATGARTWRGTSTTWARSRGSATPTPRRASGLLRATRRRVHGEPRRPARRPGARGGRHRHAGSDALPPRQAGARGRQARAGREAAGHARRRDGGARRDRRGARPDPHAGPPAALPPRRAQAEGADRRRRARRRALHLRQPPEPRDRAHERERALVARRPRPVGDPVPARRGPGRGRRARPRLPDRGRRGRRLLLPALPLGEDRAHAPVVARPAQDAADDRRRRPQDGRLRRHGARAQGDRLREGAVEARRDVRRVADAQRRHLHPEDPDGRAAAARVPGVPAPRARRGRSPQGRERRRDGRPRAGAARPTRCRRSAPRELHDRRARRHLPRHGHRRRLS